MAFKILLLTFLGYLFMRLVYKPKELQNQRRDKIREQPQRNHDDEYVDYEEVE